jgi:hypothetical protein
VRNRAGALAVADAFGMLPETMPPMEAARSGRLPVPGVPVPAPSPSPATDAAGIASV